MAHKINGKCSTSLIAKEMQGEIFNQRSDDAYC